MPPRPPAVGQTGPTAQDVVLHYLSTRYPVVLTQAAPVATALAQVIRGWQPRRSKEPVPATAPQCHVTGTGQDFRAVSGMTGADRPGLSLPAATSAVIADLAQDYCTSQPGSLLLPVGAVGFAGKLLAFAGPAQSGKSTLIARLSKDQDMQIFCDAGLPLAADDTGIALGLAPRLRLPLPASASAGFAAHVALHMGPRDHTSAFVCAPTLAAHGTKAPLSVVLILARGGPGAPFLQHLAPAAALPHLLPPRMTDRQEALATLARLAGLLARITCLRLVYRDLEPAVALIRQAFGGAMILDPAVRIAPAAPRWPAVVPIAARWGRMAI